jgi:pyruvate dehydrogenase E2 component (dihydrolipoamide acetyltransferase)
LITIGMPKLSDSMEDGVLVRWLLADGAVVGRGDEIAEIETDKATMTYEADDAGVLHIVVAEGDTVAVGAPIAHLLGDGEAPPPASNGAASPAASSKGAAVQVREPVTAAANGGRARVKASPLARRVAAAIGVDLHAVSGSGPHGRIVKADVEAAAAAPQRVDPSTVVVSADSSSKGAVEIRELSRVQQVVARRMSEAKATAPDFALRMHVDMAPAIALRQQLRAQTDGPLPSYNDLVIKASALALRAHPLANGAYRDGRFELFERVNIGMAVAAQDALLVPTVFDADKRPIAMIAGDTRALAEAARDGRLTAAQMSAATFTVSNLGMFGVHSFTAVLNPPQAAILAVGGLEDVAVVRDGALVAGQRMTLTLTCDHRILYGAQAAEFLAAIRDLLQQPLRLLL